MRIVSTSIHIDASPAQVWDILTDVDRYHEWNPFYFTARGTPAEGGQITLHTRLFTKASFILKVRPVIEVCTENKVLRWFGGLPVPKLVDGRHSFELTPVDHGVELRHYEVFTGTMVPLAAWWVRGLHARYDELNNALKTRAEAQCAER